MQGRTGVGTRGREGLTEKIQCRGGEVHLVGDRRVGLLLPPLELGSVVGLQASEREPLSRPTLDSTLNFWNGPVAGFSRRITRYGAGGGNRWRVLATREPGATVNIPIFHAMIFPNKELA